MSDAESMLPMMSAPADALYQVGDLLEVGVLTTDERLVVRGWNRWLEAASGVRAAEVLGRPLADIFPELGGSAGEAAFRRALSGETVMFAHRFHRYLLPLPPALGFDEFAQMQQSARIAPLRAGERITGAVALIQDVTERVAREEELRRAMERAEQASQAKSDFMAALSHELRTPLTGMIGYADILLNEISGPLRDLQKQHVERMKSGAWHLYSIIEEILAFSRVEAGMEQAYPEVVDAIQLARDAAVYLEPQATAKGLDFRLDLPAGALQLETDPRKVRQILLNLLGNAVKFTDVGEVELRLWTQEDWVCFTVRDTGPGIPADQMERVFEPFTRVDQFAPSSKSGTGLGLPLSRRLAQLLGGDVAVESLPARGSSFLLRIPRRLEISSRGKPAPPGASPRRSA